MIPFLSDEEERELGRMYAEGSLEARDTLVRAHLKYVVAIAKRFTDRGVSLEDLIAEGNIGLLFAAEEFDPDKGRFVSYAAYWIKKAIFAAIRESSGITKTDRPHDRFDDYRAFLKKRLENKYGKVEKEPFAWLSVGSLDEPMYEGSDESLVDYLADDNQNPEKIVVDNAITEDIDGLLSSLPENDRYYIYKYFGLKGFRPMTVDEIAKACGMSSGKVNRHIRNALRKLRKSDRAKEMYSTLAS